MNTKTVYLFDEVTGAFAGTYEAHQSPKDEPGTFITPTCSTPIAPANPTDRWVDGAWTPAPPPPLPTLEQARASRAGELYAAYQAAIAEDVTITTAGGVTKAFQADGLAISNLQSMLAAFGGSTTPAGFYWVSSDNTRVPFTSADMRALAAAMGSQGWAAFQRFQDKKAAIQSASTLQQVQKVTW